MTSRYYFLRCAPRIYAAAFLGLFSVSVYATPNVVISIPPVHSLVSALMQGVAEPVLLFDGGQSPHSNSLKPSLVRQVARADLLVWIGPDFEISLRKSVAQQRKMRVLTLIDEPKMHILPVRQSKFWQTDHASHEDSNDSEHESPGAQLPDMHLWLSAENALEIVAAVQRILTEMDPQNAQLYRSNALQVNDKILETKNNISHPLQAIKGVPYLVFHDAYQYFEKEYALSPVGAVTLNPERKPGIKTMLAIEQNIELQDVQCIFHEPQFQPRLVARIAEDTGIRSGELDPIGASIPSGPDLWFDLMLSLRDDLLVCLQD
jgi:zinc transport system substrate-binding protein